jgi:cell volume regulation protein A
VQPPDAIEVAKLTLLMLGGILGLGVLAALFADKLRIPDVPVLLIIGMIFGPTGLGLIDVPVGSTMNQIILIFGAAYILFDGGATLRLAILRQTWITISVISTLGILITGGVTAIAAHALLDLEWPVALLLGAVIASTDPATLVPVFRQIRIRERVAQTVMSESAFNDAMGAILTFSLLATMSAGVDFSLGSMLTDLLWQSGIGILIGALVGFGLAWSIGHPRQAWLVEHASVLTLIMVIAAYLAADTLHASGFMAVFIVGIFHGNLDALDFKMTQITAHESEHYIQTTAFIMRVLIFVLLGAQVDFGLIFEQGLAALGVVLIFMLVARPLTVLVCAAPDRRARWSRNELLFMCWTRETGVIPGALAGMLLALKAPGAPVIASVTLVAIVATILVQATTTRWLAQRLGLLV